MGNDPTYVREEIDKNRVWRLAYLLSELDNDAAPLGWSDYIKPAELLIRLHGFRFQIAEEIDRGR